MTSKTTNGRRRQFTLASTTLLGTAWLGGLAASGSALALGDDDAASGIREALRRGAEAAVGRLGRDDGFLGDARVRIELPGFLDDAAKLLRFTGRQRQVDELVTAMNRAAEAAVPLARDLLVATARDIQVEDALRIVRGGETSVTDFFARRTRAPLGVKFLPLVTAATDKVALADKYEAVAGKAARFGLVKDEDADLPRYVTRKALDGLYFMIGEEERKIRRDPIGTGSALLRKVFSI